MNPVMSAISSRLATRMAMETLRRLQQRGLNVTRKQQQKSWVLSGSTVCARDEGVEANLEIIVTKTWMIAPPVVKAKAPFIRNDVDWHVLGDTICYVHPTEWYDLHMAAIAFFRSADPLPAVEWSACWMLDAIDNLVHKHFLGWQVGLTTWPEQWDQWKHGTEGLQQYEEERKKIR